ncbi:MAG: HAD hydrolase-like protein [Desulfurococcales archaeon]|nr:HAD hydrolase-like protein [Desulfurococcales archaeon]
MRRNDCKIRIVLFDFDGTIVDTMDALANKASEIISKALAIDKETARKSYLSLAGRPFREQLKLLGVDEPRREQAALEFEEFKKSLVKSIKLDPLVINRLNALRSLGLKIYLSTNTECSVIMENKDLTEVFDGVLCHDPLTGSRKGRHHLEELTKLENVELDEIVFVGDSLYDLEIYGRLGIKAIKTRGLWVPEDKSVEAIIEYCEKR